MKFVGDTIVKPELLEDGSGYQILIPQYDRAAIGIFPGTKVFLTPVRNTRDIIVTPIDPDKWGDLWRLEATLADTPGAARSVVEALVQNRVNILVEEGLSDYAEGKPLSHTVSMILDLKQYYSDIDGRSEWRTSVDRPSMKPNHLISKIVTSATPYLRTTAAENDWALTFSRMSFFYRHKEYRKDFAESHVIGRNVVIDPKLVSVMYPGEILPEQIACHLISDTEEKYIKVRFLEPTRQYFIIRIEHKEAVGSILAFMNTLKEFDANILNSYSRLTSIDETAIWYAFAEFERRIDSSRLVSLLKTLDGLAAIHRFGVSSLFGFEQGLEELIGDSKMERYSPPRKEPDQLYQGAQPRDSRTGEKGRPGEPGLEASKLEVRPFYAGKGWEQDDLAFMAVPFSAKKKSFYDQYVKEPIKQAGLLPIRVDELPSTLGRRVRDVIDEYIARSRVVVADVTGGNGNVLLEVGLAQAIGRPVLFLCEEEASEPKLLFDIRDYRHILYSSYNSPDLAERIREELSAFLQP